MRHTACVSSFVGNSYIHLFPYKETHFFGFIQFLSCIAQLCNLVAHLVGAYNTYLSCGDKTSWFKTLGGVVMLLGCSTR